MMIFLDSYRPARSLKGLADGCLADAIGIEGLGGFHCLLPEINLGVSCFDRIAGDAIASIPLLEIFHKPSIVWRV